MTASAPRLKLAVCGSLPPDENGPASYLAAMLAHLSRYADLTLLVEHPSKVASHIRDRYPVGAMVDRFDPAHDLVLYHVANNPYHGATVDAAREGPAGLLVVHDVSLHHLEHSRTVGSGRPDAYRELLSVAHGELGEELFDRFLDGPPGGLALDRFLLDLYGELLDHHLGAQVHSDYARELLRMRRPGYPVWKVPHFAPPPAPALDVHARFGIPRGRVVVCHAGFVYDAKQYPALLEAFAEVVSAGDDAHLLFLGEDRSGGDLDERVTELGLQDRVTVSGWTCDDDFQGTVSSVDVVVSLRWPHVGESSGTLASSLSAGRPVILEPVGTWGEVPADVVRRCDLSVRPVAALAEALTELVADGGAREALGARARAYAQEHLDIQSCARQVVAIAGELAAGDRQTPAVRRRRRVESVRTFLEDGLPRLDAALNEDKSEVGSLAGSGHTLRYHRTLASVPPAFPGARLLDLGSWPPLLRLLDQVWGYEVSGTLPPDPLDPGPREVRVPPAAGLPAASVRLHPVDLQRDRLPHETGSVDVVTCWEVLEHLGRDPMHLLAEVNRVLAPGGVLHLTTPNAASAASVRSVLAGGPPGFWTHFTVMAGDDRHNREYTPAELRILLAAAGLSADGVRTQAVWREPDDPVVQEGMALLEASGADLRDREDNVVVLARKVGPVMERYPMAFYDA